VVTGNGQSTKFLLSKIVSCFLLLQCNYLLLVSSDYILRVILSSSSRRSA